MDGQRVNMENYLFRAGQCKNIIFHKGKGVKKRKGFKFPEATIHSRPVIICNEDFMIYKEYGTWYLKILCKT